MLKTLLLATALFLAVATSSRADGIGVRDLRIAGSSESRALFAVVWYPTPDTGPMETVAENLTFQGIAAIRGARVGEGMHPLVVLSHGYGGSWRNLSWLAGELAARGYIVAAPDHPGTTTFDRGPAEAAKLWERPRDLSRLIDALRADNGLAAHIDAKRIAVVGHSLGGWTAAALAGARFDTQRFIADCKMNASPRACSLTTELGLDGRGDGRRRLEDDLGDPRIGAFVSLDLGLARGFSPESLAALRLPALVIAAGIDIGDMPAERESGYLAKGLPAKGSVYTVIPDAMHFSFLQICKPGAAERIEAETPGDGIVCKDGGTWGRAAIHREVADRIITFLGVSFR